MDSLESLVKQVVVSWCITSMVFGKSIQLNDKKIGGHCLLAFYFLK